MPEYHFPPEEPQDYLEYFKDIAARGYATSPAWSYALEAAELWVACNKSGINRAETLRDMLVRLTPYRWAGTIFNDLWEKAVQSISDLPVREQIALWRTVFDPANHGKNSVPQSSKAQAILVQWETLADLPAQAQDLLIASFGRDCPLSREWLALAAGVDLWLINNGSKASLLNALLESPAGKAME